MTPSTLSVPPPRRSAVIGGVHRQLHWAAIRSVCRNHELAPHTRRAKLRLLVEGLARSANWATARLPGTMPAR